MSRRETIDTGGDRRDVRRDDEGKFTKSVNRALVRGSLNERISNSDAAAMRYFFCTGRISVSNPISTADAYSQAVSNGCELPETAVGAKEEI